MAGKLNTLKKIIYAENVKEARENGRIGFSEVYDNATSYIHRKSSLARSAMNSTEASNEEKAKAIANLLLAPAFANTGVSAALAIGVANKISKILHPETSSAVSNTDEEDDNTHSGSIRL